MTPWDIREKIENLKRFLAFVHNNREHRPLRRGQKLPVKVQSSVRR